MQSLRDKSNGDGQSPVEKQQSYMYPKGPGGGRRGRKESAGHGVKGEMGDAGSNGAKRNLKLPGVNIDPELERSTNDSEQTENLEKQQLERDPKNNWTGHDSLEKQSEEQKNFMYQRGSYPSDRRGKREPEAKGEMDGAGSNSGKKNFRLQGDNLDPKPGKSTENSGYLEKQELGKNLDDEGPKSQRRTNHNVGQSTVEKQSQQNIMYPKGPGGGGRRGRKDSKVKWIISDTRSIIGRKENPRLPEARIKNQRRP